MLVIEKIEKIKNKKFNIIRRKTKKTQILLFDTKRRTEDYINKLIFRNNGEYDDVPHFIITKLGDIYEVFNTDHFSNTFNDEKIDKKLIKIAIENLGWLNKSTITGIYHNWINDPYRSEPFISNWRNKFYWDKYEDIQIKAIKELCSYLCEKHNIIKQIVPSQAQMNNINNFNGIVCKSNYSDIYTDINPSFNMNEFTQIEHEQLRSNKVDVEYDEKKN